MGALPDDVLNFTYHNWRRLGLTPVLLYRLLERGWSHNELDSALRFLIGEDYADVKQTEWIERLESHGVDFPEELPVVEILDRLVFAIIANIWRT